MAETMRLALRDARVGQEDVGYISAHGPECDLHYVPNEARALTLDMVLSS